MWRLSFVILRRGSGERVLHSFVCDGGGGGGQTGALLSPPRAFSPQIPRPREHVPACHFGVLARSRQETPGDRDGRVERKTTPTNNYNNNNTVFDLISGQSA